MARSLCLSVCLPVSPCPGSGETELAKFGPNPVSFFSLVMSDKMHHQGLTTKRAGMYEVPSDERPLLLTAPHRPEDGQCSGRAGGWFVSSTIRLWSQTCGQSVSQSVSVFSLPSKGQVFHVS